MVAELARAGSQVEDHSRRSAAARPQLLTEPHYWYNPGQTSRESLLPAAVAIIGTLLTAFVVAHEWERGTMEALLATAVGRLEMLAGKIVPYFALGMAAMGLSVGASVWLFGLPFRGLVIALVAVSAAYLAAMLTLGLLISTQTKNQFVACQAALVAVLNEDTGVHARDLIARRGGAELYQGRPSQKVNAAWVIHQQELCNRPRLSPTPTLVPALFTLPSTSDWLPCRHPPRSRPSRVNRRSPQQLFTGFEPAPRHCSAGSEIAASLRSPIAIDETKCVTPQDRGAYNGHSLGSAISPAS